MGEEKSRQGKGGVKTEIVEKKNRCEDAENDRMHQTQGDQPLKREKSGK